MKKVVFNIILLTLMQSALGQTSTSYDFNTPGDLTSLFNGTGSVASVTEVTTGGISNSGGIKLPSSANAVFATKVGYSLGPAGSSDTFESFIKSEGNSGYSGVGFTASTPTTASSIAAVYRPNDALGISVHGGGFVFHNGATSYSGSWNGTGLATGITAIKSTSSNDLINSTDASIGSPERWYKIIFKMTRATLSAFDMRVEVWPSNADGTLRYATASAIFEVNGVANSTLQNAPILHSYFNFSGYRVTYFDNFAVNLTGGGSVIQAGAPVVLTSSASESNGVITANGNVSSENGGTVTERGFVYSTSVDPTIANTKVVSGSGLGTFTGSISGLSAATTYYVRAYATNSLGTTSYGSDLSFTTASVIAIAVLNKYGEFTSDALLAVDKYGAIGSAKGLNQYGRIIDAPLPADGFTAARAGISALLIKTDYPSSTNGVYWIDVPGYGPKQTYCLMDNKYNGGGWMLAMKATGGNTFNYDANFWTTPNTLNPSDITLNDADAKYDVMNGFQAKDIMALWPDISNISSESGSIDGLTQWSWLQNNFNSGSRITLIAKFAAGIQDTYYTANDGSMSFSGFNSGIFSKQEGFTFYGINYSGNANAKVRWGFAWNNEADQGSNDDSGGLGMSTNYGNYSAGDFYWNGGLSTSGINRSARVELYIR